MRILLIALAALILLASVCCERRNIADSAINTNVKSKLAADTETSALKINVETNGGVVTLTGIVPTQAEKSQADSEPPGYVRVGRQGRTLNNSEGI